MRIAGKGIFPEPVGRGVDVDMAGSVGAGVNVWVAVDVEVGLTNVGLGSAAAVNATMVGTLLTGVNASGRGPARSHPIRKKRMKIKLKNLTSPPKLSGFLFLESINFAVFIFEIAQIRFGADF